MISFVEQIFLLGFSPPTMVTRSRQANPHQTQLFSPMMIKSGDYLDSSMPMLKQESSKELVPFSRPFGQKLAPGPAMFSAPNEVSKNQQHCAANVTRSGKVFKKEKVDEDTMEDEGRASGNVASLRSENSSQDLASDEFEGPLDLSKPRSNSKKAVVVRAILPGKFNLFCFSC